MAIKIIHYEIINYEVGRLFRRRREETREVSESRDEILGEGDELPVVGETQRALPMAAEHSGRDYGQECQHLHGGLFLPVNAGDRAVVDGRLDSVLGSPALIIGFRRAVVGETARAGTRCRDRT